MNIFPALIDKFNLRRFFSGDGPQQQPVILHRKKVYILPTRQGLTFSVLLLLMLIGSINYSNSMGYMLTFLLASLSVIGILFTYQNLLNLSVTISQPEPVYSGHKVSIPFHISNNLQHKYAIQITHSKTSSLQTDITDKHYLNYQITTGQRGYHKVPRFTFITTFPLGLFKAWSYVEVSAQYLVYPKPAGTRQLPDQSFYKATLSGDQGHGSDDFAGQRKYNPGDSLRHVNWKALAKQQDLLTKQFGGDRCEELWLDWSQTAGLAIEQRLSQLSLWIIEAENNGISYGLRIPGTEISPGYGDIHKNQCMKSLALFNHV